MKIQDLRVFSGFGSKIGGVAGVWKKQLFCADFVEFTVGNLQILSRCSFPLRKLILDTVAQLWRPKSLVEFPVRNVGHLSSSL